VVPLSPWSIQAAARCQRSAAVAAETSGTTESRIHCSAGMPWTARIRRVVGDAPRASVVLGVIQDQGPALDAGHEQRRARDAGAQARGRDDCGPPVAQ